jgi:hypothetical protein
VQSIVSKTITQAPPSYACTPAPGVHFDYVNSITLQGRACIAPSTIHVAGLELSGCLRPLTAPSQVPLGEQAILERLAPNSDRIQLHQNLQQPGGLSMALLLGNAYRSDGPVRVNGVDLIPHNGSAVLVLPLVRQLGGSNVGLAAGGSISSRPSPG